MSLSTNLPAQTILIDSTFDADGEIFPFGQNDTIYGLSISGSVDLYSDTSLVRVILSDTIGNEWMVYEAYPMIVTDTSFDIEEECDETCYLDEFHPYSLKVQIIGASFELDTIYYSVVGDGDMQALQYQAKRSKDLEKISLINQNIASKGWNWIAGDNPVLEMYFFEKCVIFGYEKTNLQGLDYYISGEFNYISRWGFIQNAGSLRDEFDWRAKHDANIPGTHYYDTNGHGWITPLRNQGSCGSCWVFSPVASVEAVTNLYFNQHCDYDLSEQDVLCCSAGGNCIQGGNATAALNYIHYPGAFDEENYPYFYGYYQGCCHQDLGDPDYIIRTDGNHEVDISSYSINVIKTSLINFGPLVVSINDESMRYKHAMSLIGYYTDENNYIQICI